jgi:hypothetical protein
MNIVPDPSLFRTLLFYFGVFKDLFIIWIICRMMVFVLTIVAFVLLIKYATYIPDNPNWKRNYDDIKVLPRNPFTEAPAQMRQSEIDALKRKELQSLNSH